MKSSAFIVGMAFLYGCSEQPAQVQTQEAPALPVTQIRSGQETTWQEYPASIEGTVNVEIRPQVDGILEKVFADEGAYVKKGDPLFKINDSPFREKFNNALARQHSAEGALANAQLEVEKLAPLVQNNVISDYQLKTARASLKVASANLEQAKAEVSAAKIDLGYTLIKAPVNGYIGRLLKRQGSLVSPGDAQALTQLSDVHEVHVYFSLGETDFIRFKEQYAGATLDEKIRRLPPVSLVLADQSGYAAKGKVDMVDGQFDKTTGAITLRATFVNADGLLRSGNTGRIKLPLKHDQVALVPTEATIELQDKIFVFAVGDSNKVSKQPISVIGKSGNYYLVKDGVKNGDLIVARGFDHLQEGQVIRPEKDPKSQSVAYTSHH